MTLPEPGARSLPRSAWNEIIRFNVVCFSFSFIHKNSVCLIQAIDTSAVFWLYVININLHLQIHLLLPSFGVISLLISHKYLLEYSRRCYCKNEQTSDCPRSELNIL